jgi:hypothetical protein
MSENSNQKEASYTPEQIAELKAKQIAFFEDQLPLLRLQTEYEECKSRIEIARLDGFKSRIEFMQINMQLQENEANADSDEPEKKAE